MLCMICVATVQDRVRNPDVPPDPLDMIKRVYADDLEGKLVYDGKSLCYSHFNVIRGHPYDMAVEEVGRTITHEALPLI